MQSAIENGRLVRERKAIGLKTPLASVTLVDADESAREDFKEVASYIKEELNCLELITEASEDAFLDYKCEPDNKLIGGALKKAYDKKLKTAISKLSSAQLREYLLAGSLMLRVEKVFNAKYLADPDYAGASDMTSSVLLRTALDENLKLMGQSREMTNRIQKLRKSAGISIDDQIEVFYSTPEKKESVLN
jgi:isoleucyl-tRNA synthetase